MYINNSSKKLIKWFKKENVCQDKLNRYLIANPQTNRMVGALPFEWIKDIPPENRGKITKEVCDIFTGFATEQRDTYKNLLIFKTLPQKETILKPIYKDLKDLLSKILKRNDINISYSGSGKFKMCSRIDIGGKSYAFSIFKNHYYFTNGHGRGYEPQNIFTCYKRGSQGRFAKPFMSVISGENDSGSFTLTKYIGITQPIKKVKDKLTSTREYMNNVDCHNTLKGICFEAGGTYFNKKYIQNRHDRETWYKFANIISGFHKNLYDNNSINTVKIQKNLLIEIANGENVCSEKFQPKFEKIIKKCFFEHEKILNYNPQQKMFIRILSKFSTDSSVHKFLIKHIGTKIKPATSTKNYKNFSDYINDKLKNYRRICNKQIKTIKKLKVLKNELQQNNKWELIKKYLEEDFKSVYSKDRLNNYPYLIDKELGLYL